MHDEFTFEDLSLILSQQRPNVIRAFETFQSLLDDVSIHFRRLAAILQNHVITLTYQNIHAMLFHLIYTSTLKYRPTLDKLAVETVYLLQYTSLPSTIKDKIFRSNHYHQILYQRVLQCCENVQHSPRDTIPTAQKLLGNILSTYNK